MKQSEQVVLRDTSGNRQTHMKGKEARAPTVAHAPLPGYIVAPPGPISHIHIQRYNSTGPTWGQMLKTLLVLFPTASIPTVEYGLTDYPSSGFTVELWPV